MVAVQVRHPFGLGVIEVLDIGGLGGDQDRFLVQAIGIETFRGFQQNRDLIGHRHGLNLIVSDMNERGP